MQGSITSKKYMRNEIWSLISYVGAPSWFVTFAPADNRHPISLYFADTKETYSPEIWLNEECYNLISRFFHLIVQMFIKHVLGVGNTSAYYGTVEQQGCLTLHLHLLLWILRVPNLFRESLFKPRFLCRVVPNVMCNIHEKLHCYYNLLTVRTHFVVFVMLNSGFA